MKRVFGGLVVVVAMLVGMVGVSSGVAYAHAANASSATPKWAHTQTMTIPLPASACAAMKTAHPNLAEQPCVETIILYVSAPTRVEQPAHESASPFDPPCTIYTENNEQKDFGPLRIWLAQQDGSAEFDNCTIAKVVSQNCYRYNYTYGVTLAVTYCGGVNTNTAEMDFTISTPGIGQQSYWQTTQVNIFGNLTMQKG